MRVQARRLRNLLTAFYESGEAQSAVRIALPVGRYVPQFIPVEGKAQPAPVRSDGAVRGSAWVAGLVAISLLVAAIAFWPHFAERTGGFANSGQPLPPLVLVEEFENLAFDEMGTPLVAGLAVEMVTDLNQFPDIEARYGGAQAALSPAEMALDIPVYLLSGVARRVGQGVQYGIVLTDGDTGTTLANHDLAVPLVDGAPGMSIDDVARYFVMRLASPRSVLHAPVRAWLAENDAGSLALYPCLAAYWLYREGPDAEAGRWTDARKSWRPPSRMHGPCSQAFWRMPLGMRAPGPMWGRQPWRRPGHWRKARDETRRARWRGWRWPALRFLGRTAGGAR